MIHLRKYIVDMNIEKKCRIQNTPRVLKMVGTGYRGLKELDQSIIFLKKYITLILLMLSFVELAKHQPSI
jgi:hypothetical protein